VVVVREQHKNRMIWLIEQVINVRREKEKLFEELVKLGEI